MLLMLVGVCRNESFCCAVFLVCGDVLMEAEPSGHYFVFARIHWVK